MIPPRHITNPPPPAVVFDAPAVTYNGELVTYNGLRPKLSRHCEG